MHGVEHSIEVFACSSFENVAAFRIGLAHAADVTAEVAFGDELREDGLIVCGWRSTKLRVDAKASTNRSGETMEPRRSALKSIFVKVPT